MGDRRRHLESPYRPSRTERPPAIGSRIGASIRAFNRIRRRQGTTDVRLAVVTGAGHGIGRATALALGSRGAHVIAADIDAEAAERTTEALRTAGGIGTAAAVDVSRRDQMEQLAQAVTESHRPPDLLVNNAGIAMAGPVLAMEAGDWDRLLGVNLLGVINGCTVFGRRMVGGGSGGRIVNVASVASYMPSVPFPAYATTKAAVLMLSECLRLELAPTGITVSAVCPGRVDTNVTRTVSIVGVGDAEQERRRAEAARLYARKAARPEAVAAAVLEAAATGKAVLTVTAEARAARVLGRISPSALRALARLEPELR